MISEIEKIELPYNAKVKIKAQTMAGHIPGKVGKGYTALCMELLTDALGKDCPYCGRMLVISYVSLDHKQPIIRARVKRRTYSEDELIFLNSKENLHIICARCNGIKREIPDTQFRKLLAFLSTDPELQKQVLDRLAVSGIAYSFSRFKKNNFKKEFAQ